MDNYINRIKDCYKQLSKSDIVLNKVTNEESLYHFQKYCNDSLPADQDEESFKNVIRSMYYTDKPGFLACVENMPHLILLTEGRAITSYFKVEYVIYIKWVDNKFKVEANSAEFKTDKHKSHYNKLLDHATKESKPFYKKFYKTEHKPKPLPEVETKQEEPIKKPDVDTFNSWADDY